MSKIDKTASFILRQKVWRESPAAFAKEVLNVKLEDLQKDIVESVKIYKQTSVASCNGIGKSFIAAVLALWWFVSFFDPDKPTVVLVTANNFKQVKKVVFKEIDRLYKIANRYLQENYCFSGLGGEISEGQNTALLKYDEQNYIIGISTDDPNAIQGNRGTNTLVIVDEASGIEEECFSAFKSVLACGNGKLLLIGNPMSPMGVFYDSFHEDADYNSFRFSAFDTPNFKQLGITQEDIEHDFAWQAKIGAWSKTSLQTFHKDGAKKIREMHPDWDDDRIDKQGKKLGFEMWRNVVKPMLPSPLIDPFYARDTFKDCGYNNKHYIYMPRVLGKFPEETSATLIPISWIEHAFNKHIEDSNTGLHHKKVIRNGKEVFIFGVDTGGGGGRDASTLAVRSGNKVVELISETKLDPYQFSVLIENKYKEYSQIGTVESINVERDGIGKGVSSNLKGWKLPVVEIVVGGGAYPENQFKKKLSTKDKQNAQQVKDIFLRMRDRCFWNLREIMDYRTNDESIMLPFNPNLKKQIQILTYKQLPTEKIQICSKDDMMPLLNGNSPDELVAVIMSFAPVDKKSSIRDIGLKFSLVKLD